ncbi:hypothetical protein Ccrd_006123 [Cynara cardunculus var. scolymus]|uniref:Uncharacterized protein n=1 Tax=Cynara cardunculus var. scolymus TaxID=59895 RepID=A0A103XJF1_CYNCS|nr:hypothetical protein Ccrd_006123 [Cynara cardunculus var. scolymus]
MMLEGSSWCCCCCTSSRKKSKAAVSKKKGLKALFGLGKLRGRKKYLKKSLAPAYDLEEIEEGREGYDDLDKSLLMS